MQSQKKVAGDYKIYMVCLLVATAYWHYAWVLLFDTSSGFGLCFPTPIYVISWSRNNWYRQKLKFTLYKDFLCWIENIRIYAFCGH